MWIRISLFLHTTLSALLIADEVVYNSPTYENSVAVLKTAFKSFIIIFFLLVFLFYWYRKILPQIKSSASISKNMEIVERLCVDPTTFLFLVRVGDTYQVISSSNKNITLIDSFKKDELDISISENVPNKNVFSDYLSGFMKKKEKEVAENKEI